MATIQSIRRRIKSVKNIRQITKAMEMVAASKLRRTQDATFRSRTYVSSAYEALARLRLLTKARSHPLFERRSGNRSLLVVFTSDRGLAGAYNSNVLRALVHEITVSEKPVQAIMVGQKGAQFVSKLKKDVNVLGVFTHWPLQPTLTDITPLSKILTEQFLHNSIDTVKLVYTDFISSIRQNVAVKTLLPIDPEGMLGEQVFEKKEVLFEPSPEDVLRYIVPRLLEVQIYQASLEALASEQAMRMVAMKSASDNAKDLIGDLTLTYNGVRQAAITQELAEISAGAEALS